jgi:septation ring formation regulator EzrA
MTRVLNPTKFTPLQLELLKFYSMSPTEEEVIEVKDMLAKFFLRKAIKSIGEIEEALGTTDEDLDKLLEDENQ